MRFNRDVILSDLAGVISRLGNDDATTRKKAAGELQHLFFLRLPYEHMASVVKIMDAMALRLEVSQEPDEHVRQRCADAFAGAAHHGMDISKYVPALSHMEKHDTFDLARECAGDALQVHRSHSTASLNMLHSFRAGPSPAERPHPVKAVAGLKPQ